MSTVTAAIAEPAQRRGIADRHLAAHRQWVEGGQQARGIELGALCNRLQQIAGNIGVTQDRQVIVFLGRTGSGKSTSINYLDPRIQLIYNQGNVVLDHPDDRALAIGVDPNESQTTYPECHELEDGTLCVDLPGFAGTGGVEQRLINAAFVNKVLTCAQSVKFVFVIGAAQFEREGTANETLRQIASFYDNGMYERLVRQNSVLLVTKSDENTSQNVRAKFANNLFLLENWYETNRVCYIPRPTREGPVVANMRGIILQKLRDDIQFSQEHTRGVNPGAATTLEEQVVVRDIIKTSIEQIRNRMFQEYNNRDQADHLRATCELLELWNGCLERCTDLIREDRVIQLFRPFVTNAVYDELLREFEISTQLAIDGYQEALDQRKTRQLRIELRDLFNFVARQFLANTVGDINRNNLDRVLEVWTPQRFQQELTNEIYETARDRWMFQQIINHSPNARQVMDDLARQFATREANNFQRDIQRRIVEARADEERQRRQKAEVRAEKAERSEAFWDFLKGAIGIGGGLYIQGCNEINRGTPASNARFPGPVEGMRAGVSSIVRQSQMSREERAAEKFMDRINVILRK